MLPFQPGIHIINSDFNHIFLKQLCDTDVNEYPHSKRQIQNDSKENDIVN